MSLSYFSIQPSSLPACGLRTSAFMKIHISEFLVMLADFIPDRFSKERKREVVSLCLTLYITSGGPLSALTCCVNVRLLSAIKKISPFNLFSKLGWELGLYYASYDEFHPDILAWMYT